MTTAKVGNVIYVQTREGRNRCEVTHLLPDGTVQVRRLCDAQILRVERETKTDRWVEFSR